MDISIVNPIFWIVLGCFVLATVTQLVFWLTVFIRISPRADKPFPTGYSPVSVVICARNEGRNLARLIPQIMEQDYPTFEVIVVNDASWDETADTLAEMESRYSNLRSIHLDEDKQQMRGKKFALTLGIKGAKYDQLLLTDADCEPRSQQWIKKMTKNLNQGKDITLGISPLSRPKGLLGGMFAYDGLHTAFQYIGLASLGKPYMGVGRNLAYKKEVFFNAGGFKSHYNLSSGDDDLFINQVANKKNTAIAASTDAMTISPAAPNLSAWWRQKSRHFTTAPRYKTFHKILLTLYPVSYYIMLGTAIWLLFNLQPFWIVLLVLGLRLIVQWAISVKTIKRWEMKGDIAWLAPLYELFLMLLHPLILTRNKLFKPSRWK